MSDSLILEYEQKTKLINCVLDFGRKHKSVETGMLHWNYHNPYAPHSDCIPIFENLCFAYALLKTKDQKTMREGMELVSRCLSFQIKEGEHQGQYPIYLHEFPHCTHRIPSLYILYILFVISRDFLSILSKDLGHCLTQSIMKLHAKCHQMHEARPFSSKDTFLLASLEQSVTQKETALSFSFTSSPSMSVLLGVQLNNNPTLFEELGKLWNPILSHEQGVPTTAIQVQNEPAVTFFDLVMSKWQGHFSERILKPCPTHIYGALIEEKSMQVPSENAKHLIQQGEGNCLFRILWGDETFLWSLASFNTKHKVSWTQKGDTYWISLIYPEELLPSDHDEKELVFYVSRHLSNHIYVNGLKSNTFSLQDVLILKTIKNTVKIQMSQEGEGEFFGHLRYGNRPTQQIHEDGYAFDQIIALRTLRREAKQKIFMKIEIQENNFVN